MAEEFPQRSFPMPPGTTRFTLIRHGQSQAGAPGVRFPLVDGHGDPPLTDLGHRQAAAVGARLRTESFDALLPQIPNLAAENRHFEFFWFPHTDGAIVKTINETDEMGRLLDLGVDGLVTDHPGRLAALLRTRGA